MLGPFLIRKYFSVRGRCRDIATSRHSNIATWACLTCYLLSGILFADFDNCALYLCSGFLELDRIKTYILSLVWSLLSTTFDFLLFFKYPTTATQNGWVCLYQWRPISIPFSRTWKWTAHNHPAWRPRVWWASITSISAIKMWIDHWEVCFATITGDHKSDFKAYSPLSSSYRVLSFDFRGHGQSSRTEPFTFHQIVEDIEGLRRHFLGADQPCIICGGSFGGFLAQQYAVTYPSRVSHLILRGTAPSHHRKCHIGFDTLRLSARFSNITMMYVLTEHRWRNSHSDFGTKSIQSPRSFYQIPEGQDIRSIRKRPRIPTSHVRSCTAV